MYVWGLHHWGNAWILAFVVNKIISNNYFMKFCWKAFQESLPSYCNDMGSVSMRSCLLIACRIGIWGGNCCGGAYGCGEGETFAVLVVPVVDFVVTVVLDMSVAAIVAAETAAIVAVLVNEIGCTLILMMSYHSMLGNFRWHFLAHFLFVSLTVYSRPLTWMSSPITAEVAEDDVTDRRILFHEASRALWVSDGRWSSTRFSEQRIKNGTTFP